MSPRDDARFRSVDGLLEAGWLRSLELAPECARELEREASAEPARGLVRCVPTLGPRSTDPAREATVEELATDGARELTLDVLREWSCGGHHRSADEARELERELARLPEVARAVREAALALPFVCARPPAAARR